jgi:hypothetical protein
MGLTHHLGYRWPPLKHRDHRRERVRVEAPLDRDPRSAYAYHDRLGHCRELYLRPPHRRLRELAVTLQLRPPPPERACRQTVPLAVSLRGLAARATDHVLLPERTRVCHPRASTSDQPRPTRTGSTHRLRSYESSRSLGSDALHHGRRIAHYMPNREDEVASFDSRLRGLVVRARFDKRSYPTCKKTPAKKFKNSIESTSGTVTRTT